MERKFKTNMYKIVSKDNQNEVWASGFYDEQKAIRHILTIRKFMYEKDKTKELIVIPTK